MFARMFPLPAGELFFEGSLSEKRLRERAITILTAMTERPGVAMTAAFDNPRESRNASNFFPNDRMSLAALLDTATRALSLKLRELPDGATVLSVQDTTEINPPPRRRWRGWAPWATSRITACCSTPRWRSTPTAAP